MHYPDQSGIAKKKPSASAADAGTDAPDAGQPAEWSAIVTELSLAYSREWEYFFYDINLRQLFALTDLLHNHRVAEAEALENARAQYQQPNFSGMN